MRDARQPPSPLTKRFSSLETLLCRHMDKLTLYHGTTHGRTLTEGLREGSYLASDIELAWYYAEVSSGAGAPTVLEIEVDMAWLSPDDCSLEEPVSWGELRSEDMEDVVAAHEGPIDARTSLALVGAALCEPPIPAEQIVHIHVKQPYSFAHSEIGCASNA